MRRAVLVILLLALGVVVGLGGYYETGRSDAIEDSRYLSRYANRLIDEGRSGEDLGPGREAMLLTVEDPSFARRSGVDLATSGAAKTTLTQSLAKRLAFEHFRPGIARIRQAGYAHGLEERLTKRQIMALWLETVEMGRSEDGWMKSLFAASGIVYRRAPAKLTDHEFLRLVAVVVAPGKFRLDRGDAALDERVMRIERLLAGRCRPRDRGDIWLRGCAVEDDPD